MRRAPAACVATLFLATTAVCTTPGPADAQDFACAEPVPAPADVVPQRDPAFADAHRFATGAGVRIAVIDTGVAPHPELGTVVPVADFVDSAAPDPLLDCDSHGTVVAGVAAGTRLGVAPDAEILSIRQTSAHYRDRGGADEPAGAGSLQTLADAIHAALDAGAHVINTSVVSCLPPPVAARVDMRVIDEALARAEAEGAVVVAAAGNASDECEPGSAVIPAHAPTVIAVGARAHTHAMAEYSVPVPGTAVSAPGLVEVAPASRGDGWAAGTLGSKGAVNPYAGTSFAAPVVAGAAALVLERYPHLRPAEVRALMYAAAEPGGGALDPFAVITQLPPDGAAEREPVVLEPAQHRASAAVGRWWQLGAAALALLALLALVALGGAASTLPSAPRNGSRARPPAAARAAARPPRRAAPRR